MKFKFDMKEWIGAVKEKTVQSVALRKLYIIYLMSIYETGVVGKACLKEIEKRSDDKFCCHEEEQSSCASREKK